MASIITKRHQARNERALQDLIRSVPGNDVCADCGARNPGWASWSLGIFLCMRCAALHRKLGTHISKVKSLSMDSWSSDQVDQMKKKGNVASNREYNPKNMKQEMPLDPDEIDMAMEKFIRQKYQYRNLGESNARTSARQTSNGSPRQEEPPSLPPKSTSKFGSGLRAVSSAVNLRKDKALPPINVVRTRKGSFEEKMHALKEMGFQDERRNETVLRELNGNVEKSVETLVRLGGKASKGDTNARAASGQTSAETDSSTRTASRGASSTPQPTSTSQSSAPVVGASVQQEKPRNSSFNPFDPSYKASSQPAQTNQQAQSLEANFQNLQVAPQPLFPNNTGSWQQQGQNNPFFNNFTPPMSPASYHTPSQSPALGHFGQQQPVSAQSTGGNPFLRTSKSQTFNSSNPFNNHQLQQPFGLSSYYTDTSMPPVPPLPMWTQNVRSTSQPALFQDHSQSTPPFFLNQSNTPPFMQQSSHAATFESPQAYQHHTSTEYPFQPQQTQQYSHPPPFAQYQQPIQVGSGKIDKNSILALYNQPGPQQQPAPTLTTSASNGTLMNTTYQSTPESATMLTPSSNSSAVESPNPFAKLVSSGAKPRAGPPIGYTSRESVDFAGLMAGRHSPDAFASLSARYS